ncbi:uncharacterized protein DFL_008678 [Arthrobotrys flagrans]|uniref:Uncharacterized protein n=1 Tax=Arthrobotrys flagrans TaxID=97331 RepID=A0A436ZPG0_ARTFL|nr:hypothetical protein DFL_008678 [Arthrobotrys flagrans]
MAVATQMIERAVSQIFKIPPSKLDKHHRYRRRHSRTISLTPRFRHSIIIQISQNGQEACSQRSQQERTWSRQPNPLLQLLKMYS